MATPRLQRMVRSLVLPAPVRVTLVSAFSMLLASLAFAGPYVAPIVIVTPVIQPGDACIPDGVGSGEETRTSKGATVMAAGVHGAHATRCPDPGFPNLASTEKLPPDDVRRTPSPRCVPQGTKVGDELTLRSYGRATVLELGADAGNCTNGLMAKVVATKLQRAAKDQERPAPIHEPTESEIQREYERLLAAAAPVQEYHVRHILLSSRADAVSALEKIRAGRPFAEVAAEASIDTGSKKKGGDLGWNVPASFTEDFSTSMTSLAPSGIVAEPVKTRFGWHVIEVLETKVGKDWFPPLAALKTRIAARLRSANSAMNASSARIPARAVCRKMVAPVRAAEGAAARPKGTVVAEMRVENGRVADILTLSGPGEYQAAVREALNKYECDRLDRPTTVVQTFEF